MNVFARTIVTTLCVSTAVMTGLLERQDGRNQPNTPPTPAPANPPAATPTTQPTPTTVPKTPDPAAAPLDRPGQLQPGQVQPGREGTPIPESRYPRLDASDVDNAIASWDPRAKQAVRALVAKYGEPNEMTSRRAYWYENGPWLWTCVRNEPVMNNWPRAHAGVIEQAAAVRIPLERIGEMARFSGAMVIDRNEGILCYRSDNEAWNTLAVNLAYQIAGGTRDAESARREFERLSLSSGEPSPLMERFTFAPMAVGSGDPDHEVGVPGSPATTVTPGAVKPGATPVTPSPLPIERPRVPDDEKKQKPR